MRGVRISYLIEHPEYVLQLAQWLFELWDFIRDEKTAETRIKELREHMNRGELPIAWVRMGMDNFSELPPFAWMVLRGAKT